MIRIIQNINNIGNRIKNASRQRGLSQEHIAQELSFTQPSYARLEKDYKYIIIRRLIKIATILKTTGSNLINEKNWISYHSAT